MREEEMNAPQPSTSALPSEGSSEYVKNKTETAATKEDKSSAKGAEPSTSSSFYGNHEFGYNTDIPYAPWRRKRYNLSIEGLHEEIVDFYHWIRPNALERHIRFQVFEKVYHVIKDKWKCHPSIQISMFGSLRTNLFLPSSDIDVLVEIPEYSEAHHDTKKWLKMTADVLKEANIASQVMLYSNAYVPIIKMIDKDTQLSVDISFNTVQGVRAANYIEQVKGEFPVIEPLVLLLKQFLHYRTLNQTFTGGLSSYGLILMLVNFFQMYAKEMRHKTIYDSGVNLGELLLRFFEVYSCEFNYEDVGICVAQVRYLPKTVPGIYHQGEQKRGNTGYLVLEDPLLKQNDVGRSTYNFSAIATAFEQALQILMVVLTVRDRKRSPAWHNIYKGSLLHLIMPFTSKELVLRNWLRGGTLSYQHPSVSFDYNMVTSTLLAPSVDLRLYDWLRRIPSQSEKKSNALKITSPEEAAEAERRVAEIIKIEEARAGPSTSDAVLSDVDSIVSTAHEDIDVTTPPMPTSTASIGTSGASCSTSSERDEMDSPPHTSTVQSEDEGSPTDNSTQTNNEVTLFKKPYNEVAAKAVAHKTSNNGYGDKAKGYNYEGSSNNNSQDHMNGSRSNRSSYKPNSFQNNKRPKSNGSQGSNNSYRNGSQQNNGSSRSYNGTFRSRRGASSNSNGSSENSRSSSTRSNRFSERSRQNGHENGNGNFRGRGDHGSVNGYTKNRSSFRNYAQAASSNLPQSYNNRKSSAPAENGNSTSLSSTVTPQQPLQNGNCNGTVQNGNDAPVSYRNAAVKNTSVVVVNPKPEQQENPVQGNRHRR